MFLQRPLRARQKVAFGPRGPLARRGSALDKFMHFVYLLKSKKDLEYYIGQTDNIQRRLNEHNSGKSKSTKSRRPFLVIGFEEYESQSKARYREYQLKNHSDRKKKFIEKLQREYEKNKRKN